MRGKQVSWKMLPGAGPTRTFFNVANADNRFATENTKPRYQPAATRNDRGQILYGFSLKAFFPH